MAAIGIMMLMLFLGSVSARPVEGKILHMDSYGLRVF